MGVEVWRSTELLWVVDGVMAVGILAGVARPGLAPNKSQTMSVNIKSVEQLVRTLVVCGLHIDFTSCCPECPGMRAQQDGVQVQQAPVDGTRWRLAVGLGPGQVM